MPAISADELQQYIKQDSEQPADSSTSGQLSAQELQQYIKPGQQTFLGKLGEFGKGALKGVERRGFEDMPLGGVLGDVTSALKTVAPKKSEFLPTPQETAQQSASYPFQAGAFLGHYAPDIIGGAKLGIGAGKLIGKGGKIAFNKLSKLAGTNAEERATGFYKNLVGDNDIGKSHVSISNKLRDIFAANKNISKSNYDKFLNDADAAGYKKQGLSTKSVFSYAPRKDRKIITGDLFDSSINKLSDAAKSRLKSIKLKQELDTFNKSKSLNDAHFLQSRLGEEGARLKLSADKDTQDIGSELSSLGSNLKQDITNSLESQGDVELSKSYKAASDYHRDNIAPFKDDATIKKVIEGKGLREKNPKQVISKLLSDDAAPTRVRSFLPDEHKNLLLANEFKDSVKSLPKKGLYVKPEQAINIFSGLESKGLKNLLSTESNNEIQKVIDAVSRKKIANRLGKAGLLTGLGLETTRHIF